MICKSQSISRTTLVGRYASIFDELDCAGIQALLSKVEELLKENGESKTEARRQCFEMYFNYLMPNVIGEMDDPCLDYIVEGIHLVNRQLSASTTVRCTQCNFPVLIRSKDYKYEDIAVEWLKVNVDVRRVIVLVFASQSSDLLKMVAKQCQNVEMFVCMFQLMIAMHFQKQMECFECSYQSPVEFDDNQVFSWLDFLNMFVDVAGVNVTLDLLKRHARSVSKDVVPKEFCLKCIA